MRKKILLAIVLVLLAVGGGYVYLISTRADTVTDAASEPEFCARHQIAEKDCPWCDRSIIEKRGQCTEHGVPEALCFRCNPALIAGFKVAGDWCASHNAAESQCTICNPGLLTAKATNGQASLPAASVRLVGAPEVPRSQRPPSITCRKHTLRVQFISSEIARNVGLEYATIERRKVTESLSCNAEVAYDGNRYAHLSSRAPGVVKEVKKDLGQRVGAGEVLAIVDSVDLGTAKAEYLQAQALVSLWERTHAREQRLLERRVSTERETLEAETKLAESRIAVSRAAQRLRNLGLTDAQIQEVAQKNDISSLLSLTVPFAGIVVERSAVIGEVVATSKSLFAIADISRMWAMLDVYAADIRKVRVDQPVVLAVEGHRGEQRGGRITWISSHVDRRTRTLKVRAELANPDGLLRAGMFGTAIISVRDRESVLVVPKTAVQWEGCCNVVFVRRSDILFEPRKVRLGYETDKFYVVEEGLESGEVVVTTGSFLLKTEILKGSIGAGCCEFEPGK